MRFMPSRSGILAIVTAYIVLLSNLYVASARPIPHQPGTQTPLVAHPVEVECDLISKYTKDYFLRNTLARHRQELYGKAMFYTRGAGEMAYALAEAHPKEFVTIWNVWPAAFYNKKQDKTNPLRCIHGDPALQGQYYEIMSDAFASMARGSAAVMHAPLKAGEAPPMDGIWGRVELRSLKRYTDVELLEVLEMADHKKVVEVLDVVRNGADRESANIMMKRVKELLRWAKSWGPEERVESSGFWDGEEINRLDGLW